MNESPSKRRRWRIGDLARAAGVTVRTLHHYEQIGLLPPPERTQSDHRLYDDAAVERLYRIRALRDLGLSLDEIGQSLMSGETLRDVLDAQLHKVEAEIVRMERLRSRLSMLTSTQRAPDIDALLITLDAMTFVERQVLARRQMRRTSERRVEHAWRVAGDALRQCMSAGLDPASDPVRQAALRVQALIQDFAGGDAMILQQLAHLRAVAPPAGLAGWDGALTHYLDQALAASTGGDERADY